MPYTNNPDHLLQPVSTIARREFAKIKEHTTVQETLDDIRSRYAAERIVYFYVVDDEDRLVGVIPTRRLLTAPLDQKISTIMIKRLFTISETSSILEAHERLAGNKLLALPIVDLEGRITGVIDVGMFTQEEFDTLDREKVEEIFELVGFRVSQVRNASPLQVFQYRFPWLMATVASGTICAVLAGYFDVTLAKSLVLAFFLTLVLGLGESVSMQSMTVTIHTLRLMPPTWRWYLQALRHEMSAALLLGSGCGAIISLIVWLWRGSGLTAVAIGGSIVLVMIVSAFWGLTIPSLVHTMKLDPRIAAGPVTLALADICTVLIYFELAHLLL